MYFLVYFYIYELTCELTTTLNITDVNKHTSLGLLASIHCDRQRQEAPAEASRQSNLEPEDEQKNEWSRA